MDFFLKPWVGPALALLALISSYLGRSGVFNRNVANTLTILAVFSAVASYVSRKQE
ncbi:MAG: hypothetical protein ACOYEQ_04105 [Bacillota bacterium]